MTDTRCCAHETCFRAQIAERTREALAEARTRGVVPGRAPSPQTLSAGRRVIELRDRGVAWRSIPATLTAEGFESATGAAWSPSKCQKVAKVVRLRAELESAAADPAS